MRDAGNHAFENALVALASPRIVQLAEPDGIHHGNWSRTHRKDVPQDAADTRCRALIGFDETWMVVRFDLESDRIVVANINDTGVLARSL